MGSDEADAEADPGSTEGPLGGESSVMQGGKGKFGLDLQFVRISAPCFFLVWYTNGLPSYSHLMAVPLLSLQSKVKWWCLILKHELQLRRIHHITRLSERLGGPLILK